MPNQEHGSQFIEQILEQTLETLSEHPAFDDETVRRLKELAGSSGLTNFQQVIEALSNGEGK